MDTIVRLDARHPTRAACSKPCDRDAGSSGEHRGATGCESEAARPWGWQTGAWVVAALLIGIQATSLCAPIVSHLLAGSETRAPGPRGARGAPR